MRLYARGALELFILDSLALLIVEVPAERFFKAQMLLML